MHDVHTVHPKLDQTMNSRRIQQTEPGDWENLPDSFLFAVAEVQQTLRCTSDRPIRTAIENGNLKATNVGGRQWRQCRIQKSALKEYLEK